MIEIEALYRQHASAVFRFAWGLCGDRSEAEDLVSETFARLFARAPRIQTQTALGYLLAIARNVYLTGRRRRRREVPLPEDLSGPDPALESQLDERADLDAVLRALGNMSEGERTALLLRVDHGLPYEEVASLLGTSVGAVKVRVHRARMRLAGARRSQERKP